MLSMCCRVSHMHCREKVRDKPFMAIRGWMGDKVDVEAGKVLY